MAPIEKELADLLNASVLVLGIQPVLNSDVLAVAKNMQAYMEKWEGAVPPVISDEFLLALSPASRKVLLAGGVQRMCEVLNVMLASGGF